MRCANADVISSPRTFSLRYCASEISRYLRMRIFCGRRPKPWPGGIRVRKNDREPNDFDAALDQPFRPSMMAATEITLVTPMTMPRMVSAERILRERSVSSATHRFSLTSVLRHRHSARSATTGSSLAAFTAG